MTVSGDGGSELQVGSVLDGKYEILGLLGAGGMGEVYKARHEHLGALRCIKVMKRSLSSDEGFRNRFLREARLATRIHHPNVALVHDFSLVSNGASYLVSEFIDGITLRQWAHQNGRFPVPLAVEISVQVLAGLHEIHKQGMIHRDISAENIMILHDGERWVAKIIDLGIAKALEAPVSERTQVGLFVGNPRYSSPEQLGDLPEGEEIDHRADLYSLGVVIYEMVTGVAPFSSKTPHGYVVKHLKQPPPSLTDAVPGSQWPPGFEKALMKALEKNRRNRYESARDFGRALKPFLTTTSQTVEANLQALIAATTPTPPPLLRPDSLLHQKTEVLRDEVPSGTLPTVKDAPAGVKEDEESTAWQSAEASSSSRAWDRFINRFGNSPRITLAQLRRDELRAFEEAEKADTAAAWEGFLASWSASSLRSDAQRRLAAARQKEEGEAREWAEVERSQDPAVCEAFLARWPASSKRRDAKKLLDQWKKDAAELEQARKANDPERWRTYLEKHSASPHAGEAREALHKLEEEAFASAIRAGSIEAADEFLNRYPGSRHESDIRRLRADVVRNDEIRRGWKQAEESDSASLYRAFANSYPASPMAREALARAERLDDLARIPSLGKARNLEELRRIQARHGDDSRIAAAAGPIVAELEAALMRERESSDWDAAWRDGSSLAFRKFIEHFPASRYLEEARGALAEASAFELALRENSVALFKAFLHDFPEGRHFAEAKIRVAKLRERDAKEEPGEGTLSSAAGKLRNLIKRASSDE
jgi:serine/threonine protein kinase/outer membrane protein assembly factor BamD (BamD/ComL family)